MAKFMASLAARESPEPTPTPGFKRVMRRISYKVAFAIF